MRYVSGYVTISDQMLREMLAQEEAIARHAGRMKNDPEYREEWLRGQAERDDDWDDW